MKLIDLIGTSLSFFKFGKTGPQIKNNAGELETRNNADSAYANLNTAILGLFSNGAFKTLLQSDPSLAASLRILMPPTKGTAGQVLVGAPDPVLNEVALSFQDPPAGTPTLDNLSLVKQGNAEFLIGAGAPTQIYNYNGSGNVFALNAGGRGGSSFTANQDCELVSYLMRLDNSFGNTGTVTGYLIQITGATIGGTPAVIATSTNSPAFDPGTYPSGVPTDATFNFANVPLTNGVEYAVMIVASATIFASSGTNQGTSTNYQTDAAGANLQVSVNQNTFYAIVTAEVPVLELNTDAEMYVAVRDLPLNYNQIDPIVAEPMDDGDVMYVTIDRNAAAPTVLPVTVVPIGSFVPNVNNVIIARRLGDNVYFGLEDTTIIPANVSINFDGQVKGINAFTTTPDGAGNVDVLRSLNTVLQNPVIRWNQSLGDQGLRFYSGVTLVAQLQDNGQLLATSYGTLGGLNIGNFFVQRGGGPGIDFGDTNYGARIYYNTNQALSDAVHLVVSNLATNVVQKIKGFTGQTADLLEFVDASNTLLSSVNAAGEFSYTAASSPDWSGSPPATLNEALDRIAAALGPIA